MDQLSKLIRQRWQAVADQDARHPDPDVLAAFAEKALAKTERVQVLEHLAQCSDCRDIVFLATPEFETFGAVIPASSSGWLRGPVLRWGALAASVAVVTVAVMLPKLPHHPSLVASSPSAQSDVQGTVPQARMEEPNDKLTALPPPSYGTLEVDSRVRQQKRPEISNRAKGAGVPLRSSQAAAGSPTPPVPQAAAVAASPALLAGSVDESQLELKKEQRSNLQVNAASEGVTLQAKAAAPAELEMTPGKAKDAPLKTQDSQAGLVVNGARVVANRTMADASPTKSDEVQTWTKRVPRWTLSSDGTLQRSFDAGKTWATIPVAGNSVFRALAAVGADIWVGGSGGSLYRSIDAGEHWLKVTPSVGGKVLNADIIGVEFTDSSHGKLTTADEQIWITANAGQTWQTN
jgi:hypothetical protein